MALTASMAALPRQESHPSFVDRLNGEWHERSLKIFMAIVLAHWAEHLAQAFQIYALGWPPPRPAVSSVTGSPGSSSPK